MGVGEGKADRIGRCVSSLRQWKSGVPVLNDQALFRCDEELFGLKPRKPQIRTTRSRSLP